MFFLYILLLGLNFIISWSNASYVGRYWSESKEVGGSFRRHVVCGYIMAVAGFTMVYGCILLLISPYVMQATGKFDPEVIADFESLASDILYLLVAVPIVLSGIRIWLTSLKAAFEKRTFSYIATAGWNSYAQIHNTISLARNAPSAFGRIVEAFGGGKKSRRSSKKGSEYIILLAIFVVVLAIVGGYLTADAIMRKADQEYDGFDVAYRKYKDREASY